MISSLHQDREGTLWVGTYGAGLFERPARGAPIRHRPAEGDLASLADNAVSSLMEDRQGVLWVGTYDGLDRFDRARGNFRLVRRDVDPDDCPVATPHDPLELLAVHEALDRLARKSPRKAELVKLRYFLSCTIAEAAQILSIAPATAEEDWTYARAWLRRQCLRDEGHDARD